MARIGIVPESAESGFGRTLVAFVSTSLAIAVAVADGATELAARRVVAAAAAVVEATGVAGCRHTE